MMPIASGKDPWRAAVQKPVCRGRQHLDEHKQQKDQDPE